MYKYGVAKDKDGKRRPFFEELLHRAGIMVPSLVIAVGVILSFIHNGYCRSVGGNLVAAGTVALIVFLVYDDISGQQKRAEAERQSRILEEVSESCERLERHNELEDVARRVGLDQCYEERPSKRIRKAVLGAKTQVDILEVSLDTMQGMDAVEWLTCKARVRIILLDPEFPEEMPLARLRDHEENELLEDKILSEVHATLQSLPSKWSSGSGDEGDEVSGSGVRLAQLMPTMSYFRIDGVAYFAPLVHKTLGNETMHMRFQEDGDFFNVLAANFEKLWKNTDMVKPPD